MVKFLLPAFLFLIVGIRSESIISVPHENVPQKMLPKPVPVPATVGNNDKQMYRQIGAVFIRKMVLATVSQQRQSTKLAQLNGFNWHDLVCKECAIAVKTLYEYVSNPDLQNQIQDFLDQFVCQKLGPYKTMCDKVVNAEIPFLFDELKAVLANEKSFCQQLHLCMAENGMRMMAPDMLFATANTKDFEAQVGMWLAEKIVDEQLKANAALKGDSTVCTECQLAVFAVYEYVSKPDVQKQVSEFVEEWFCGKLGPYKSMCKLMLRSEMPLFWKKLQSTLSDNKELCQRIHFCSSDEAKNEILQQEARSARSHRLIGVPPLPQFQPQQLN